MNKHIARAACAAVFVAALALSQSAAAQAQTLTIRIGHVMPGGDHFEQKNFEKLAADVAKRSNGRIQIKIFPSSQLGSEREQTEQVNLGALEMFSGGGAVQLYAPQLGVWALPFIFNGPEHFNKVMDGPIGDELRQMLLAKSNIRLLAIYPNGERMFFNNKRPITKLADFKGIKIRVDDQPVSAQIWRALGANPVPIAYAETYTALQSGVVDAAENPALNIIKMRFYEVGKYVTLTRHSLTVQALMVNEPWWQKLSPADRELLTAAIKDFTPARRQAAWDADAAAVDELKKLGAQVAPVENPQEFTKALAPLYDSFGTRTGATDLVRRIIAARS